MALNCSIGSAPLNLLPSTVNCVTFFHADIEAGRLPVREFSHTSKVSMSTNAFTASAIVPWRLEAGRKLRRQGGGGPEQREGEGGQHASVGKRAASAARGSGWAHSHFRDGAAAAGDAAVATGSSRAAGTRVDLCAAQAGASPVRPAGAVPELPPRGTLIRREARGSAGAGATRRHL